jgi:hypothetical protein
MHGPLLWCLPWERHYWLFWIPVDFCPERRPAAAAAGILLLILLLTSCRPEQVLVVSDPYIDVVQGRKWGPSTTWFKIRARVAGAEVIHVRSDQENDLYAVLDSVKPEGIVVISPWNAATLDRIPPGDIRFIVAGASPGENQIPQTTYIALDRKEALSEIGRIAAGVAHGSGSDALAVFNATTEIRKQEKMILSESFQAASADLGSTAGLIIRDIAEAGNRQLPSDFSTLADSSSVLLLFAGTFNLKALADSGNASAPVITEFLGQSDAWKDRIIISVEDNPGAMNKILLSQLTSEAADELLYYAAKLVKGDLYGSQRR